MTREEAVWVVDRVEGRTLVLVEDDSGRTVEVGRDVLGVGAGRPEGSGPPGDAKAATSASAAAGPQVDARPRVDSEPPGDAKPQVGERRTVREGTVLRVPLTPDGEPSWPEAVVDEALRRARIEEAERTLDELKRRDPGGDIVL